MASAATIIGRSRAGWTIPALLLLIVGLAASLSWLDPWIVAAAAHQKALFYESLGRGSPFGYALAGVYAGGWGAIVILLRPMLFLGMLVFIESWLAPPRRVKKDLLLAWVVRGIFIVAAYLISLFLGRWFSFLPGPLLDFADASSPAGWVIVETFVLFLATLFVTDFFQYWAHRAYHHFPLLWRFHAVHHAPRDLDVLHKFQHPLEAATSWFLVVLPVHALLAGVDATQLGLLATFFLVLDDIIHMNARVHFGPLGGRVLVDNRYHFIHHSRDPGHYNTNFAAVFPILDWMFGTYRRPSGQDLSDTGLNDRLPASRLSHFLLARLPRDKSTTAGAT